MRRPTRALALEAAALAIAAGLSGTAAAQTVLTHPNEHAAVSALASAVSGPATRLMPVGQAWMLERVEPASLAASAGPAARTPAVAAQRSSNPRAVTTPSGAWVLEEAEAAAPPSAALPDPKRFSVRSAPAGQQVLEVKDAAPAVPARSTAVGPVKFVDIKRSELATRWPAEPAPMTLYRIVD